MSPTPQPLTALDKVAIAELYAKFNTAIYGGDADAWAATFTADGVFEQPEFTYIGTAELRRKIVERQPSRLSRENGADEEVREQHWFGSLVITGEGDRATARCNSLIFVAAAEGGDAEVASLAQFEDSLRRVNGEWLFERRTVRRS